MKSGEETYLYTLTVKDKQGGDESYRVQIKFDQHGKQDFVCMRKMVAGAAKVRVLLDVLCLHRYMHENLLMCVLDHCMILGH